MKEFNNFRKSCRWHKSSETRVVSSGVTFCDKCTLGGIETNCNKEKCLIYVGGEEDAANKKKTVRKKTGKN